MNNLDTQYQSLLRDISLNGTTKSDRTGTGTVSVFGRQIRHRMSAGFPILTTKKLHWNSIVTELLWFLRGDTNIRYLVDRDCNIWNGDAYKNYCKIAGSVEEPDYSMHIDDPEQGRVRLMTEAEFAYQIKIDTDFADKWGDLGPIYGKQWRDWNGGVYPTLYGDKPNVESVFKNDDRGFTNVKGIDQIQNLINTLKTNPDDRRMLVSAWNVGEIDQMVLPPCHYGFQVWTRELTYIERYDIWFANNYESGFEYNSTDEINFDDEYWTLTPTRAISLTWNQRSVDTFLGLPYNIASYGLLLSILGGIVNMVPDELIGNLGDTHIYLNHRDQVDEQLTRTPKQLPKLDIKLHFNNEEPLKPDWWVVDDFQLVGYNPHPSIKAPLSN